MLANDPKRRRARAGSSSANGQFVLYVEGARDREILGCWARRVGSGLTRCIENNTVILGGRRPARAIADFRKRGGVAAGYTGLIVLDRDDLPRGEDAAADAHVNESDEAGLEVFTWSLRHIESYLLVPDAIRRMLGLDADDRIVERSIDESATAANKLPMDPARSRRPSLHAKRILGAGGSLSEALGTELRAGDIAKAMRLEELHGDVRVLFDRIETLSGLGVRRPEVVIRS